MFSESCAKLSLNGTLTSSFLLSMVVLKVDGLHDTSCERRVVTKLNSAALPFELKVGESPTVLGHRAAVLSRLLKLPPSGVRNTHSVVTGESAGRQVAALRRIRTPV